MEKVVKICGCQKWWYSLNPLPVTRLEMAAAGGALPWVEQETIEVDADTREVRFAVKDKSQFNEAQMKQALKKQGFPEAEVRSGP